jgi:hypothetical protein
MLIRLRFNETLAEKITKKAGNMFLIGVRRAF